MDEKNEILPDRNQPQGENKKDAVKNRSEKMGVMPMGKLIITMSLPAMISMLVQALYNVVDSMFVSAIGGTAAERALDAVSIAFPFQLLYMAFALGIAVGSNSLIARHLGEGDRYSASKVASTGLVVSLAHCAVFMILGATAIRPVARLFTGDEETVDMVVSYLSVCMIFSFGMYVEVFVNKVNQAMSRMTIPMVSQLIGAITNIILDPVFIFAFKMGVTGAAVATVIGQIFAMIFTVITFAVKKSEVSISPKFVRMKGRTIVNIYKIGLPTIILNAIGSFTIMAMNGILRYFRSKYGITILGVYFKVQSFVFMPCFGLNQGILPILAYNYGANKKDRFYKAFRIALTVATVIMAVGFTLFQTVSRYILSVFGSISANEEMLEKAVSAFRIISVSFLPAGLSVITITMFQSIGKGVSSMFMSVLRQVGVLLPAAFLLSLLAGVDLIWWSYPIAEIVVIVIFFPLALKTIKKVFYEKERAVNTEAVNVT
ncbi:MAG: MATE family efflux transporter [Clostridia bacterium]|nr:MATE family efflux transporter [Clostridia bacterium]